MNVEFIEALNELCKTRRIKKEVLLEAIEQALMSAYKKNFDSASNARVTLDAITGEVAVYAQKKVVDQVENPQLEISVDNPAVGNKYQLGDIVEVEVTPRNFGRIAAQAAKQVIVQRIREAERGVIYDEYIEKEAEILTAIVLRIEGKTVYVDLNRTEGVLEPSQQMPDEEFHVGDRIKVYVMEVNRAQKGPQVMVSRTNAGLVKRLFEMEVPEIQTGVVQIKSIAREAGYRTKMAVSTRGRLAVTDYKVLKRYAEYTLTEFSLRTGRTHQIRVHAKYINHPVVGDKEYGYKRDKFHLNGQLLHAKELELTHPRTGERMRFTAPLPAYFADVLKKLR